VGMGTKQIYFVILYSICLHDKFHLDVCMGINSAKVPQFSKFSTLRDSCVFNIKAKLCMKNYTCNACFYAKFHHILSPQLREQQQFQAKFQIWGLLCSPPYQSRSNFVLESRPTFYAYVPNFISIRQILNFGRSGAHPSSNGGQMHSARLDPQCLWTSANECRMA